MWSVLFKAFILVNIDLCLLVLSDGRDKTEEGKIEEKREEEEMDEIDFSSVWDEDG